MLRSIISIVKNGNNLRQLSGRSFSVFSTHRASDAPAPDKSLETPSEVETQAPKEEKSILVDKEGPITLIGINRPEHRNAINAQAALLLVDAFTAFEHDDTSSVAVLYGIGGSFCSGYEISELSEENVNTNLLMQAEGSVGPTRRQLKKPVVCGINGYCVANGLELALMCDLRVMEESAILGFFNRRFGVPVVDGGTARLPAMIGLSRALDLILTGRKVTAKEAFEFGIVNRIIATGTALGQAVNLAYAISKNPQAALNHDRNSVYSSVFDSSSFDASIQNEIMYTSQEVLDEMKEGVKLFKAGMGRSGKTANIKEISMADWEKKEILHEKQEKEQTTNDNETKR